MRGRSPIPVGGQISSSSAAVSYAPAITWPGNTPGSIVASYVHLPGVLFVWGAFQNSAGTATATLTIPYPAGFTVSTAGSALVAGAGAVAALTNTGTSAAATATAVAPRNYEFTFILNVSS